MRRRGTSRLRRTQLACLIGQTGLGGTEKQLYYFLRQLPSDEFRASVIVSGSSGAWEQRIRALGIEVLSIGELSYVCKLAHVGRFFLVRRPAVAFSWSLHSNIYLILARLFRVPAIGAVRNSLRKSNLPRPMKWLCLHLPNHIIANSSQLRDEIIDYGLRDNRVSVVPNAVERKATESGAHYGGTNDESHKMRLVVLGAGQLCQQKNFDFFIDVVGSVAMKDLRVSGVIVGDGVLRGELMEKLESDGLRNVIYLRGQVSDPAEIFSRCDVFFLSSDWEGMPNVLMEAMAEGIPSVCTDVSGVRDLISDGVEGFIVPIADGVSAELRLETLLGSAELREKMGAAARKRIRAFTPERAMAGYRAALQRVL